MEHSQECTFGPLLEIIRNMNSDKSGKKVRDKLCSLGGMSDGDEDAGLLAVKWLVAGFLELELARINGPL